MEHVCICVLNLFPILLRACRGMKRLACCAGKGDGVHVLTGPIYVCGAEPGDVLQVRLFD